MRCRQPTHRPVGEREGHGGGAGRARSDKILTCYGVRCGGDAHVSGSVRSRVVAAEERACPAGRCRECDGNPTENRRGVGAAEGDDEGLRELRTGRGNLIVPAGEGEGEAGLGGTDVTMRALGTFGAALVEASNRRRTAVCIIPGINRGAGRQYPVRLRRPTVVAE